LPIPTRNGKACISPGQDLNSSEPKNQPFGHSISAFLPAYNDAATIGGLVDKLVDVLPSLTHDYEVIVVNDGSSDETAEVLRNRQAKYACLRVVTHPQNRGYGGALISGFSAATKDVLYYTDGDAQYDVASVKDLVAQLSPELGFVNGFKISRSDPWYRVWIGKTYGWVVKKLFGLKIRDVDCDVRLIRTSLLRKLELHCQSGMICVELIKKLQNAGAKCAEVPVHHYPRISGSSQFFSFRHLSRTFVQLPHLWYELVLLSPAQRPTQTPV